MKNETTTLVPRQQPDFSPQNFEQALAFSEYLAKSELVPTAFRGKSANCLIAMQWGAELGLKPLQALQNLAIINGRPALWGDAVIAIVRSSPICEYVNEEDDGQKATCRVKRRGEPEQARSFSMSDAKIAGLENKAGPWTQYPKRMRQMRARAFALRDVFPDLLRGMPVAEEVMDVPAEKYMGQADEVAPQVTQAKEPPAKKELPAYTDEQLETRLSAWQESINKNKVTPENIINKVGSAYRLSEAQIERIRSLKKQEPVTVDAAGAQWVEEYEAA